MFIAHCKRGVCSLKKASVDVMSVIEDNLLESGHLKSFELAECKCFDLDEVPLVCKLQDRRPLINRRLVDIVLSGERR
jgi:hypothetical protein